MPLNLEIDTVILTEQPTSVSIVEPAAVVRPMANGGVAIAARAKGTKVRVDWGVDVSPTAVMAELRAARNSLVSHRLEWDDVTGTHHDINVAWVSEPNYNVTVAFQYGKISVEFLEEA